MNSIERTQLVSRPATIICCAFAIIALVPVARAAGENTAPHPRNGAVTFARDIAPIVYRNCASCHRDGDIGPFPLVTYNDVKRHAAQVAAVTTSRFMPPWHADSHGQFQHERKLAGNEIATIRAWVDNGSPLGDAADLPPTPKFRTGWTRGEPDMTVQLPKPFMISAEGPDIYRFFRVPVGLSEDRWISATECRPGNSRVVHHVVMFVDRYGRSRDLDKGGDQPGWDATNSGLGFIPGNVIGGWAPGTVSADLPDDVGILLPKGSDLVLQIHYHKDGKVEYDQTKLGLYFARRPIDKRMRVMPVVAPLNIPAGDPDYVAHSMLTPAFHDLSILSVMPHMHTLGKCMSVNAHLKSGEDVNLVNVPRWDFNWQTTYEYVSPVRVPAGSTLTLSARYDNSAANPNNPSKPPKNVTWGEATTDEMAIAFVWFTYDDEHLTKGAKVTDMYDQVFDGGPFADQAARVFFGSLGTKFTR